jgi:phosphatidylinositol alpha-mannosyltransferase
VLQELPGARFLIAGGVTSTRPASGSGLRRAAACEFLGSVSDADKASLLASVDVYVAPQTGGESFGIVLVEAMSAGAAVLASDLEAFAGCWTAASSGCSSALLTAPRWRVSCSPC